ncbi:peptidase S8/S53 domain-containing protein [Lactarius quietus]|nr:peptidase S8/S53 domain-containing protein [Lactarius quietus]
MVNALGLQTKLMDISTPSSPQYGQCTFVAPKSETVTAVNEWMSGNGLNATVLSPFGDWMGKRLFDAEFSTFVHDGSGKSVIRTMAYSIPASLMNHLEVVHPTITFPLLKDIGSAVAPCDAKMTPACLQQLYGIPSTSASQSSNKLAVTGYNDEFANEADLEVFLSRFTDQPPRTFTLETIDGGSNSQNGTEAGTKLKLCNAYAALGARGVSILFASGDGGVSGPQKNESCRAFVPTFPSGCPFVTSVGATQNIDPEISAPFSSGGFSNYFPTPSYQTAAKAAYLDKLGSTHKGLFNSSGRGFPDVAAAGTNCVIVVQGVPQLVDGTSCSTPIFASVISLLNDRLIAAGGNALGFLNPFFNPGCDTDGFPATVTGLGTPNWEKLLASVGL